MLRIKNNDYLDSGSEDDFVRKQSFDMLSLRSPPAANIENMSHVSESENISAKKSSLHMSGNNTDESGNSGDVNEGMLNPALIHKNPFISPVKKPLTMKRVLTGF